MLGWTDPNDPNTTYPTYVDAIDGAVAAHSLGSTLNAATVTNYGSLSLGSHSADIDIDGTVQGSITIVDFDPEDVHSLHIGGSFLAEMTLGNESPT